MKLAKYSLLGLALTISHQVFAAPAAATESIAVPSYFYPCSSSSCSWTMLDKGAPKVGIAIINPNSGSGSSSDPNYVKQTKTTQAAGISVLGYVYTSYGDRSLSSVEKDINNYYNWYKVDGIFFDEGYSNDCGKQTYYQTLNSYVKAKGGKGITIVNYGTNTPSCYINASDILVNFESNYSDYLNFKPSSWTKSYPASHFWQIVYGASQSSISNVMKLAALNNAGWVYVTSLGLPNPYGNLPSSSYWNAELAAV
jgi:hypothetical protein